MTALLSQPTRIEPETGSGAPGPTPRRTPLARYAGLWRSLPGALLYILPTLPIVIVGLSLASVALSLGAGLAVLGIGVLILVCGLWIGRGFAELERRRLTTAGLDPIPAPDWGSRRATTRLGALVAPLASGRWWLAFVHTLFVNPVVGSITWSIGITWLATALGGVSFWFWRGFLPSSESSVSLNELLWRQVLPDTPLPADRVLADGLFAFGVGIVFLATLPLVARGLVLLHHQIAVGMLGAWPEDALRAELAAASRARGAAVSAEAGAVRRLERDIHDGPQQRLIRLQMDLAAAERRLGTDPEAARGLLGEARSQAAAALDELRALSKGLMPPLLQDRGLVPALEALAGGSAVPTITALRGLEQARLVPELERGVYFIAAELLTNVAKHSGAGRAVISVEVSSEGTGGASVLIVRVVDDGVGGAHLEPGHGLAGLTERAQGLEGTLTIEGPGSWDGVARGSSVAVRIPVR